MNIIALIGNVASDPELRHTSSGRAVCNFRLAVSRPGGEQADFFTIVTWERQAEISAEYLQKGRRVAIEGRLHQSSWKDKDNETKSKVEIIAHRVHLLGSPRNAETTDTTEKDEYLQPVPSEKSDDGIPF